MGNEETQESPLAQAYTRLVEQRGDKVLLYTKDCVLWGLTHPNCEGCPSELGCGKVVRLLLVSLTPLHYQPKDFEDFVRMRSHTERLQDEVLNCASVEALQEVPIT